MELEKITMNFLINGTCLINGEIILFEEAPDDEDVIFIETTVDEEKFSCKKDSFFSALQDLRRQLESRNIQIICNGAGMRNVRQYFLELKI